MKRRKFLLTSGSALLGSTALSSVSQRPVLGLNFDLIGVENTQPSEVDSIIVDFQNFELVPKYVDEGLATIKVTLNLDGHDSITNKDEVSLTNGRTVRSNDLTGIVPIVKDGISTNESVINGNIMIEVDHSSISDSYTQSFTITDDSLLNGLVGYWPFHEWSGKANDLSRNGNKGTINGVKQGISGRGGLTAYGFNGTDNYVNLGSDVIPSPPFSISVWVRPQEAKRNGVIKQDNDYLEFTDSEDNFYMWTDPGLNLNSDSLGYDEWHHCVVTTDSEGSVMYVNGEMQGQSDTTATFGSGDTIVGNWPGHLNGAVSNLRIYNRSLSENEMDKLYNIGVNDYTENSLHDGSDNSALSRWKFDKNTSDSWGSHDGSDNTSSGFSNDSIRNNAKEFDGSDDYIDTSLSSLSVPITISCWVKPNNLTDYREIFNNYNGTSSDLLFRLHNGSFRVLADGVNSITTTQSLTNNNWYHLATTISEETIRLYINGVLVDSGSSSSKNFDTGNSFRIGGRADNNQNSFQGNLDDLRVYNRSLNQQEIQELYQWGTRGKDLRGRTTTKNKSDMTAWWKLNETSGNTAYDSSGNGYNGTIYGAGPDSTGTVPGPLSGRAYKFNGDGDYVDVSPSKRLSNPITVSAWFNPDTTDGGAVVGGHEDSTRKLILGINGDGANASDRATYGLYTGGSGWSVATGPILSTNNWYHLCGVTKQGNNYLYVNGKRVGSVSTADTSFPSLFIGAVDSNVEQFVEGDISNVRVYNRGLTPQEVSYLYEQRF